MSVRSHRRRLLDQLSTQTPYPCHLAQQAIALLSQSTPLWHLGDHPDILGEILRNPKKLRAGIRMEEETREKSSPATVSGVPRCPKVSQGVPRCPEVSSPSSASGRKQTLRRLELRLPLLPALDVPSLHRDPWGILGHWDRISFGLSKQNMAHIGTPKTEWLTIVSPIWMGSLFSAIHSQDRPARRRSAATSQPGAGQFASTTCRTLSYIGESKTNEGMSSKSLKNRELLWDLGNEIEFGAR